MLKTSSFCGFEPELRKAFASDLQIVCGEHNIGDIPEAISSEKEVVLDVLKFTNHPQYNQSKGPIQGHDIAVYHVNDTLLQDPDSAVNPSMVYPACLPRQKSSGYLGSQAILAAWRDPKPRYFSETDPKENALGYRLKNLLLRQGQLEEANCTDPPWMNSNTYYPPSKLELL